MAVQRSLQHRAVGLALILAAGGAVALASPAAAEKLASGEVCFHENAGCVAVGRMGERIVEIRDAKGKAIVRTGKDGHILVLSPRAYARRDDSKKTYVIGRIGDRAKTVKTDFIAIASPAVRIGFGRWAGPVATAFGMTARPTEIFDPNFRSTFRDRWRVEGDVQGISPDGVLTDRFPQAIGVQKHGDYFIISHTGGTEHSIADLNMRQLSGRSSMIRSFAIPEPPPDPPGTSQGPVSPRLIWATRIGTLGNGQPLYQLLPRRMGDAPPDGLIGVVPMVAAGFNFGWGCPDLLRHSCTPGLPAWAAIWAGASGPEVSLLNVDGEPHNDQRYRALNWRKSYSLDAGILEELSGQVRLVNYRVDRALVPKLAISSESYPSRAAAEAALDRLGKAQSDAFWARWAAAEAEKQREQAARYAAWQAERAAEERARADRAAREAADLAEADRLIATRDRARICQGWTTVQSFYAKGKLTEACAAFGPAVVNQGSFLGNLAAGLAAYNAGRLGPIATGSYSSSGSSGSSTSSSAGSGDFDRRMRAIDTALRVISDPNWNGAAAASQR